MKTITIPAGYLPAISLFTAKKDIRYYLNGVAINAGHLVATNGHYCGALLIDGITDVDLIIPTDTITQCLKLMTTKQKIMSEITLSIPDDQINKLCTITVNGTDIHFAAIDGRFPDWKRIIVENNEVVPFPAFDWNQMTLFSKASRFLGISDTPHLLPNGKHIAQIKFPGCDVFKGCIMPMKIK